MREVRGGYTCVTRVVLVMHTWDVHETSGGNPFDSFEPRVKCALEDKLGNACEIRVRDA